MFFFCFYYLSLEDTHIRAPRKRQADDKARKRCRIRKVSEKLGDITHRELWSLDGINHAASLLLCTDPVLILVEGQRLS